MLALLLKRFALLRAALSSSKSSAALELLPELPLEVDFGAVSPGAEIAQQAADPMSNWTFPKKCVRRVSMSAVASAKASLMSMPPFMLSDTRWRMA